LWEQNIFWWNYEDSYFVLDNMLGWIFIVVAHWNNSPQVDMHYN